MLCDDRIWIRVKKADGLRIPMFEKEKDQPTKSEVELLNLAAEIPN